MALLTSLLILAASVLSAVNQASAVTYTVGDAENWNSGVNYLAWSQKHNFTVGDALRESESNPRSSFVESCSYPRLCLTSLSFPCSFQLRGRAAQHLRGDGGDVPLLRLRQRGD